MCVLSAESEEFCHPSLCNAEGIFQLWRLQIGHLGGEEDNSWWGGEEMGSGRRKQRQ